MPFFCVKSVKIHTSQKKFTQICSWGSWQISGMISMFSMCAELPPRAPIPDSRIAQFMQPCVISAIVVKIIYFWTFLPLPLGLLEHFNFNKCKCGNRPILNSIISLFSQIVELRQRYFMFDEPFSFVYCPRSSTTSFVRLMYTGLLATLNSRVQ